MTPLIGYIGAVTSSSNLMKLWRQLSITLVLWPALRTWWKYEATCRLDWCYDQCLQDCPLHWYREQSPQIWWKYEATTVTSLLQPKAIDLMHISPKESSTKIVIPKQWPGSTQGRLCQNCSISPDKLSIVTHESTAVCSSTHQKRYRKIPTIIKDYSKIEQQPQSCFSD